MGCFLSCCCPWLPCSFITVQQSWTGQIQEKNFKKLLLSYWSFIIFLFSPRLPAFTYFSKSSVNCLFFFFVSCSECLIVISWESTMCLLHLVGTRSLVAHVESFFIGVVGVVVGSCPLIELVFEDPRYLCLVVLASPREPVAPSFLPYLGRYSLHMFTWQRCIYMPHLLYPGETKCLKLDPCPQRAHGIVE